MIRKNRSAHRRYHFLKDKEGELYPFATYNNRVWEGDFDELPDDVRELAENFRLISFEKEVRRVGYTVLPNNWEAKCVILTPSEEGFTAVVKAKHKATGKQRTMTVKGDNWSDAIWNFWDIWNQEIRDEYGHLGIHTHLILTDPVKYQEIVAE